MRTVSGNNQPFPWQLCFLYLLCWLYYIQWGHELLVENDIPVKIIKYKDIFSYFIHHNFNNLVYSSIFPSELKKADITPIHKKKSKFDIENYHPVSMLPVLSKIYERYMFDQMYSLIKFSLNINEDSGKVTTLSITFL